MRLLTIFVFIFVLASIVPVSAQQVWYLSNVQNGTVYIMYKGVPPTGGGFVTVYPNEFTIWIADQPALVNVTFPATVWTGNLTLSVKGGTTATLNVSVGVWDGSAFRSYGHEIIDAKTTVLSIPTVSFTVPKGCWLALNVTNLGTTTVSVKMKSGGTYSYLEYTSSVPAYPLPEILTVLLVAVGMVLVLIKR